MTKPPKVLVQTWLQLATENREEFITPELKESRQRAANFLNTYFGSAELALFYLEQEELATKNKQSEMTKPNNHIKASELAAREFA